MRFVAGHEPQIRQASVARATRSVSQKHAPGELFVSGPICHKHLRDGGEVFCQALEPFSLGVLVRTSLDVGAVWWPSPGCHRARTWQGPPRLRFSCHQQRAECQKHARGTAHRPHTESTAAALGWRHLARGSGRPPWREICVPSPAGLHTSTVRCSCVFSDLFE